MMEGALLLSLSPDLWIDQITVTTTVLVVHLVSTQLASLCPLCGQVSEHVHSRYRRVVADVPCGSKPVSLSSYGAQVLLSYPDLPTQDLHGTAPRSPPALGPHDESAASSPAGTGNGDRWRRRRMACS
jgi:zinc-finger of transposase IS204/IS1001/IS1096/IS1165